MEKVPVIRRLSLLISLLACLHAPAAYSADFLTVSGCSVSYIGYLRELAHEYERRTGIKINVRGGGTVGGLENLKEGKVDFAATCRNRIKGDPDDVRFIQVAWDALVFIVHPSNPVKDISRKDVQEIYLGKVNNWKQLQGNNMPMKVFIARSTKGLQGVEASLREMVLNGKAFDENPNLKLLPSGGIVEQTIEKTPEGFAATGFTSARTRMFKMLNVDGIPPTKKNIMNGRYPLKRPLYLVIPGNPKTETRKVVDFILSRDGQQFISSLGAVSLLDIK